MSSLTGQQLRTLKFLGGFLLAAGLGGGMLYDLGNRRAETTKLRQEVERKEKEVQNVKLPAAEEESKWAAEQKQIESILITDQNVPQFFEEVTRIANESGLERVVVNSDDRTIDPAKAASPHETVASAVGVRRYMSVTVKFQGQYPDVARFLGEVSRLKRPIEYQTVDLKRNIPLIEVTVVMNVYKRESA